MNARLQMKLLRAAVVDSFDVCDPTRSHELAPSRRLALRAQSNRAVRRLLTWAVLALAVIALIAIAFPSSPAGEPATIPVATAGGASSSLE